MYAIQKRTRSSESKQEAMTYVTVCALTPEPAGGGGNHFGERCGAGASGGFIQHGQQIGYTHEGGAGVGDTEGKDKGNTTQNHIRWGSTGGLNL